MKEKQFIFIDNGTTGQYVCTACGHALFEAAKRFEAGCGFPSFWSHIEGGVQLNRLTTYGRERTQLVCRHCGHHLGHLFLNKFTPTGVRYCINQSSIRLEVPPSENPQTKSTTMAAAGLSINDIMQTIRENRSSESNFATLQQELDKAISEAERTGDGTLITNLQEVKEKYLIEYEKAKETGGSAWPEFEKFVTQFERALTDAKNGS